MLTEESLGSSRVWRSTLVLSFASCYIMWAITFMAQWHPLIEPRRANMRMEHVQ